jgi:site-specific DNA recombinase
MPRFGVLLRVSTEKQRDAETIKTQEMVARQRLETAGVDPTDVLWFRDDGVSGDVPIWDRPGGAELKEAVEAGRITQAVYVYGISRVNREDILSFFALSALLDEYGLALRSITEGVDTSEEGGDFVAGVLALVAREQKRQQLKLTKAGRLRKAKDGKWPGRPPYGHRVGPDGALEIHPAQAPIKREIFRLFVEEVMGAGAIATHLNDQGIPGPYGDKWYNATILSLLRNPVAIGRAFFGKSRTVRRKGKTVGFQPIEETEWIEVPAPPIVEETVFWAAQRQLELHQKKYAHTGDIARHFLLHRLVCQQCGVRFWPDLSGGRRPARKRHPYYRHEWRGGARQCPGYAHHPAGPLDESIWARVLAAIEAPETWQEALAETEAAQGAATAREQRELADLDQQAQETNAALARLEDAYILRGTMTPDRYETLARELNAKQERLARRRNELRLRLEATQREQEQRTALAERMQRLQARAREATHEHRRAIIGELIRSVSLDKQGDELILTIEWKL